METQIRVITQEDGAIVYLDLSNNQPITANYQFKDIQDIKSNKGSFTFTFRVPSTTNNELFFSNYFEVTQQGNFNPKKKVKATILQEGIDVLDGFLQLKNVYSKSNSTYEYECIVFSGVSTLGQILKAKQLNEFDFIEYNHTMTPNFVASSMQQLEFNGDIVYSLYDYGIGFIGGQTEDSCQFPINTFQSINSAPTSPILVSNLKPQIRIKKVFNKILEESGFTYESTFIDTTMEDLYMDINSGTTNVSLEPDFYLINAPVLGNQTFSNTPAQRVINFNNQASSEYANLSGQWNNQIYTPAGAWQNSELEVSVTITCPTSADGSTFQISLFNNTDSLITNYESNIVTIFNGTATATINDFGAIFQQGKEYSIILTSLSVTSTQTYTVSDGTFYTNPMVSEGSTSILPNGSTIVWADTPYAEELEFQTSANMPKIKAIDFITSLCSKFNLVIIPDKNTPTHLYVEPYTNWINEGNNLDWTEKLDISKDVQLSPTADLQAKTLLFTDAESKDFMNASFNTSASRIYGTQLVDNSDSDFGSDKQEIKTIFTPTITSYLPNQQVIKYTRCYSVNGEEIRNEPAIRLSFYCGYVTTGSEPVHLIGVNASTTLFSYALFQNYKDAVITPTTECLSFMNEASGNLNHPLLVNGAYALYWKRFISETYNRDARILKANFLLDSTDIATLNFNDIVFVKNEYFRINRISNYSLVGKSNCSVELIKVENVNILDANNNQCVSSPLSITLNGIVNFAITGTTNPVTPTQSCCEAYGYTWTGTKCTQLNLSGGGSTGEVADELDLPNKFNDDIINGSNTNNGQFNAVKGKSNLVSSNSNNVNGTFNYISSTSDSNSIIGNANTIQSFVSNSNVIGKYNLLEPYRNNYSGRIKLFTRQNFEYNNILGDFSVPLASGESLISGGYDRLYKTRGRSASAEFVRNCWTTNEEIIYIGQNGEFDINNSNYYNDIGNHAFRMQFPSMISFEITIVGHNRGTIQSRSKAYSFRKYTGTIQNTNNSGNISNKDTTIEIQKENPDFTNYGFKIRPANAYFDGTDYYNDGMFYFEINTNGCTRLDNVDWTIDVKYTLVGLQNLGRTSGSATFNPTSISGCVLWLDANNFNSIVFNGGSTTEVDTWNDLSGNSNNVQHSLGTSYPDYGTNTTGVPLPHMHFNGINEGFSSFAPQLENVSNASNTLFVVYQADNTTGLTDGSIVAGVSRSGQQVHGINVNKTAIVLGPEKAINGTFNNSIPLGTAGSGWAKSTSLGNAAYVSLGCQITRGNGGYIYLWLRTALNSSSVLTPNTNYKMTYEITANNGCTSFRFYRGGFFQSVSTAVGTYTVSFTQGSQTSFMFSNFTNNSDITINNVSIKEEVPSGSTALAFLNNQTLDFSNQLDYVPSTTRQLAVGVRDGNSRTITDQLGNTDTKTNSANVVGTAYNIGGIDYIGGSFLDPYAGKIYEIVQYNVLLTDEEIEEVTNYLETKWNTLD